MLTAFYAYDRCNSQIQITEYWSGKSTVSISFPCLVDQDHVPLRFVCAQSYGLAKPSHSDLRPIVYEFEIFHMKLLIDNGLLNISDILAICDRLEGYKSAPEISDSRQAHAVRV